MTFRRFQPLALAGLMLWLALPAPAQEAPAGGAEIARMSSAAGPDSAPEIAATTVPAAASEAVPVDGFERIERAWRQPASSLNDRVARTRRTSLELGIWNLDSAARAVLSIGTPGEDPLDRAHAAVRLAPDLPAGRMALAEAFWIYGEAPMAAIRTAFAALAAIPRHLEASLWFGGGLLFVLGLSLVTAGAWCIVLIGGAALPHAAHDLGDVGSTAMPQFARIALLASLLLIPVALGEGFMGLCLSLMGVGVAYGDLRQRLTLFLAASVVILGAYPVIQLAGNTLAVFVSDPVAEAAFATAQGFSHPVDQARIEVAAPSDSLAAQALAVRARRAGRLGEADRYYQALLRDVPNNPAIANNAANVRLNLGHLESALALYRRSVELRPDSVTLFNLSQAHGRAFEVEELSRTLADAQRADGQIVAELTALQGAEPVGFVVDLPIEKSEFWLRILHSNRGERIASQIRAPFAPGRIGRDSNFAVAAFAAALVGFATVGSLIRRSGSCSRCGIRICRRCDPSAGGNAVCGGCEQLFQQSDTTDRELRLARMAVLREREERLERRAMVASIFIPGVAGLLAKKPVGCLMGSVFAMVALLSLYWRNGVVPDPLIAGAAGPFASLCIAMIAAFAYVVVVLISAGARRNT